MLLADEDIITLSETETKSKGGKRIETEKC